MWAQFINALLGIFLIAAPSLLGLRATASDNVHIFGPVITTFAVVSWWEATRSVRLWNVALGAWLVISPIFLQYESSLGIIMVVTTGLAVVAFSFVREQTKNRFGDGWKALWRPGAMHEPKDG